MNRFAFELLAMAPPAEGSPQSPLHFPIMMVLMAAIFYFMLIRPQQRREKERRAMMDNLKKGDRVVFSGGILGSISSVKDKTVMVQVADGVKMEVTRSAIALILEKGEEVDEAALQQR